MFSDIKHVAGALPVLFLMLLFSCVNDDSDGGKNNLPEGVVGNWYMEDEEMGMFAEYAYTSDGAVYIDEYRKMYGYKRNSFYGTYSISDNRMFMNIATAEGETKQDVFDIVEQSPIAIKIKNGDSGTLQLCRMVATINVSVGDELDLDSLKHVYAYAFDENGTIAYEVKDNAVVTLRDASVLVAKLIGVTYVKAVSSAGYVVLKISVTDKDNLWNDFSKVLGKDFNEVESVLGSNYAYKNDSVMQYFFDDYYINHMEIFKNGALSDSIVLSFNEHVSSDVVTSYYANKLIVVDSASCWYTDNENYLFSTYSARYDCINHKLTYTHFESEWDDRRNDYGLTYDDLISKYGHARAEGHGTAIYYIGAVGVKHDFLTRIAYSFKNGTVDSYSAYVNVKVPPGMVDDYIDRKYHYYEYNRFYKHGLNIQINGKEFILMVRHLVDSHELSYFFVNNN